MENCTFMGGLEIQTFPKEAWKPGWRSGNSFAESAVQDVMPRNGEVIETGGTRRGNLARRMIRTTLVAQRMVG
jgi:hypothetical protein